MHIEFDIELMTIVYGILYMIIFLSAMYLGVYILSCIIDRLLGIIPKRNKKK